MKREATSIRYAGMFLSLCLIVVRFDNVSQLSRNIYATMYVSNVYTGVNNKFGISWGFEDVCVVRQNNMLQMKSNVEAFQDMSSHLYSSDYVPRVYVIPGVEMNSYDSATSQFGADVSF